MDFIFMGNEAEKKKWTILVAKERVTKMIMSAVLPSKSSGTFAARRVLAFMREVRCEFGNITLKSDNEEAIKVVWSPTSPKRGQRELDLAVPT